MHSGLTRREWWIGIGLIVGAVLVHALIPRYDWRPPMGASASMLRVDRWLGRLEAGHFDRDGRWVSLARLTPAEAPLRIIKREPLPPDTWPP